MKKILVFIFGAFLLASCAPSLQENQVCPAYSYNKGTSYGAKVQAHYRHRKF